MKCNHLLSCAFLLLASGPLLAHPSQNLQRLSVEDGGVGALDDLSLSEQNFPSQDGLRYSTLISGSLTEMVSEQVCFPEGLKEMSFLKNSLIPETAKKRKL
ncbi:hypothetical protein F7725_001031 [Dissostichus mawsoni]|uniref:Uncharacterized protein n=1 Tax=Dissostichus mawsoni TaxID=36200 RepID=A0A7J5ZGL2_DISMA|nr:hypothetical protein F7725_001031 [Dissostichus mawsoni]